MSKLSLKMLGLATAVAGFAALASIGGAAATTLPVPAQTGISDAGEWGDQLINVDHRGYRHPRYYGHHQYWRHRHYRHRRPGYGYYYGGWWYANPWWNMAPEPVPNYGGNAHVNWCLSRYRSYNPATNMYLGYDGHYHRCISPY